jgi:septal ring factor EnvC (AmiA/AmiB activator)
MLQVMETQLAQLSKIIRSHQAEIDQLRQALTAGCAERQQLQQQLQQVLQQQQHAQVQLQPQAPRMQGCNPALNKLLPSPSLGTSSSSRDGGSDLKAKVSALHSGSSSTFIRGRAAGRK